MVLEVGFETTFAANKDGGESTPCTQKCTHAPLALLPDQSSRCIDCLKKHGRDRTEKDTYDAFLFYPRDLEGRCVELDAEAFEVIEAWAHLPATLKTAVVSIVRSKHPSGSPGDPGTDPLPSESNIDAKGGAR